MPTHQFAFRPRARLVAVLGEHLISDQAVGLIELVKNSYDADATEVTVELLQLADAEATTVLVKDNGSGMTLEDITQKWLSPAVDHKDQAKREVRRSALGRLPLGEKGVGRFAVHQIGRKLELVTRARGHPVQVLVTAVEGVPVHLQGGNDTAGPNLFGPGTLPGALDTDIIGFPRE
jgi:HSP90 family molecular chaperone